MAEWNPKMYFNNNRTLEYGEGITEEQMDALRKGEEFTVVSKGRKLKMILMDSYDTIRQSAASVPAESLANVLGEAE